MASLGYAQVCDRLYAPKRKSTASSAWKAVGRSQCKPFPFTEFIERVLRQVAVYCKKMETFFIVKTLLTISAKVLLPTPPFWEEKPRNMGDACICSYNRCFNRLNCYLSGRSFDQSSERVIVFPICRYAELSVVLFVDLSVCRLFCLTVDWTVKISSVSSFIW